MQDKNNDVFTIHGRYARQKRVSIAALKSLPLPGNLALLLLLQTCSTLTRPTLVVVFLQPITNAAVLCQTLCLHPILLVLHVRITIVAGHRLYQLPKVVSQAFGEQAKKRSPRHRMLEHVEREGSHTSE